MTRRSTGLDYSSAVALWQDWFPAAHVASDAFLGMRASRLSGGASAHDGWQEVDFLSPEDVQFDADDPNGMQEILLNAGLLGQTPYWLREGLLARREGSETLSVTTRGRGTAAPPTVPPRILGLGYVPAVARHIKNVEALGYAGANARDSSEIPAADARRQRHIALLEITLGRRTVSDVLKAAAKVQSHPYRAITLVQLLTAQPRVSVARAEQLLNRLAAILGKDRPEEDETVGWLLDDRTARRRLLAWMEVHRDKRTRPGFPWR